MSVQDRVVSSLVAGDVPVNLQNEAALQRVENRMIQKAAYIPDYGNNTFGTLKTLSNILSDKNGATTLTQVLEFLELFKPMNTVVLIGEMIAVRDNPLSLMGKIIRFLELHNCFWLHHVDESKSVLADFYFWLIRKFFSDSSGDSATDVVTLTAAMVKDSKTTQKLIADQLAESDAESDAEEQLSGVEQQADTITEGVVTRFLRMMGIEWIIDDETAPYTVAIASVALMAIVATVGSTVACTVPQFVGVVALVNSAGMFLKNIDNIKSFFYGIYTMFQTAVCGILGVSATFVSPKTASLRKALTRLHQGIIAYREGLKADPAFLITSPERLYKLVTYQAELDVFYRDMAASDVNLTNMRPQLTEVQDAITLMEGYQRALSDSAAGKQEPVILWLGGEPGHGKSTSATMVVKALELREGVQLPSYTRNPGDAFWSGYAGHPVVIYDDFGSSVENVDHLELQQLKSCATMKLIMPDIPNKGQRCCARYVIICSNMMAVQQSNKIVTPASLMRRRDFLVHIDCPKYETFKTTHGRVPGNDWYADPLAYNYAADVQWTECSSVGAWDGTTFTPTTRQLSSLDSVVTAMVAKQKEYQKIYVEKFLASQAYLDSIRLSQVSQQADFEDIAPTTSKGVQPWFKKDKGKGKSTRQRHKIKKTLYEGVMAATVVPSRPIESIQSTHLATNEGVLLIGPSGIGKTAMLRRLHTHYQSIVGPAAFFIGAQQLKQDVREMPVGTTHLFLDDITVCSETFEFARKFVMQFSSDTGVKRLFMTGNDEPFKIFSEKLDSQLCQAFVGRLRVFTFAFNVKPVAFYNYFSSKVYYSRTDIKTLGVTVSAPLTLLYDNMVSITTPMESHAWIPSIAEGYLRTIKTQDVTIMTVATTLAVTVNMDADYSVLVSGSLSQIFGDVKSIGVNSAVRAFQGHKMITGSLMGLASFFYSIRDSIVSVNTDDVEDEDLMLLLRNAQVSSPSDVKILIFTVTGGYQIVCELGQPINVYKLDEGRFLSFAPRFWESVPELSYRLEVLSKSLYTTFKSAEQELEIAKVVCGTAELHESETTLRKFCNVVYFMVKVGVSGLTMYQGLQDAMGNKSIQDIGQIKLLLQAHKKQLEGELQVYRMYGKPASKIDVNEDFFKVATESAEGATPKFSTDGVKELDKFIKRDGKWYAKELKITENLPIEKVRATLGPDVGCESCDFVKSGLYGKIICMEHMCEPSMCPSGEITSAPTENVERVPSPIVTYHAPTADLVIYEASSDQNWIAQPNQSGHVVAGPAPKQPKAKLLGYSSSGQPLYDHGSKFNQLHYGHESAKDKFELAQLPPVVKAEASVISAYASIPFSYRGFLWGSLTDCLKHFLPESGDEKEMLDAFLGSYLNIYNGDLTKMRPLDRIQMIGIDCTGYNQRFPVLYDAWYKNMLTKKTPANTVHESSKDPTALSLARRIAHNTVFIYNGDKLVCRGLVVMGPYVISVRHVYFLNLTYKLIQAGQIITGPLKVWKTFEDDVCIYKMDCNPHCRELIRQLPSVSSLQSYEHLDAALVVTEYEDGLFTNHIKDVCTTELKVCQIPSAKVAPVSRLYQYTAIVRGVAYNPSIGTQNGDCGSPLIVTNTQQQAKLFALHNSASTVTGYAVPIYREMFDEIDAFVLDQATQQAGTSRVGGIAMEAARIVLPHQHVDACREVQVDDFNHFTCVGTVGGVPAEQIRSRIWRSPMSHLGMDGPYEPAILDSNDERLAHFKHVTNQPLYDVLLESVRKWDQPQFVFDAELMGLCVDEVCEQLAMGISKHFVGRPPIRKWSLHTAINGDTVYTSGKGLNMQTSVGYPLKVLPGASSKGSFFDLVQAANGSCYYTPGSGTLGRQLTVNYSELLDSCQRYEKSYVVFSVSLKDEVVHQRKIYQQPATRSFAGAPTEYVLVWRRYFGSVAGALTDSFAHTPIKVGINPRGSDWHQLFYQLAECSVEGFDADFKNWDATVPVDLVRQVPKVYNYLYKKFDPNWSEDDDNVRNTIHSHLQSPLLLVRRSVIQSPGGQVSGQPGTSIDNCIMQMLLFNYVFAVLSRRQNLPIDFFQFRREVKYAVYGDDNIVTVSPFFSDRFNMSLFQSVTAECGMVCTSSMKDETVYLTRSLFDMSFLSRGFVLSDGGNIVGPLHDRAFIKMYQYVIAPMKHSFDLEPHAVHVDLRHCEEVANVILYELLLYGKREFDQARADFVIFFINNHYIASLITFDAILTL